MNIPFIETIINEAPASVVAGETAVIRIRPGYTRLRDHIILGGSLTLAHLESIQVWINGQIQRELGSADDLDKRNQYYGMPAHSVNSILTVSHIREGLRRFVETHATGVGMGTGPNVKNPIHTMEIRIKIASGAPAGSISSYGEVSQPTPPGLLLKETLDTKEYTTNGEKTISDLITGPEEIDAIFIEEDGATVDSLRVFNQGRTIHERTAALNKHIIDSGQFRVNQSGLYILDKSERGFGKEPLLVSPVSRFELKPTLSGISGTGKIHIRKVSFVAR